MKLNMKNESMTIFSSRRKILTWELSPKNLHGSYKISVETTPYTGKNLQTGLKLILKTTLRTTNLSKNLIEVVVDREVSRKR